MPTTLYHRRREKFVNANSVATTAKWMLNVKKKRAAMNQWSPPPIYVRFQSTGMLQDKSSLILSRRVLGVIVTTRCLSRLSVTLRRCSPAYLIRRFHPRHGPYLKLQRVQRFSLCSTTLSKRWILLFPHTSFNSKITNLRNGCR